MRISSKTVIYLTIWTALLGWIALEAMSAFVGPASYRALAEKREALSNLEAEVAGLVDRRERLARRADRLNAAHIDAELLDERIRAVLGYVAEDEWVASRAEIEKSLAGETRPSDAVR